MTEPKAEWRLADVLKRDRHNGHLIRNITDPTCELCRTSSASAVGMKAPEPTEKYDASEQDIIIDTFAQMLRSATSDGGRKRAAGLKPPWYVDDAHEKAIFSHLNKWKHGEVRDPDSGAHPLVHLAWRALAIAYQESYGKHDPRDDR